MYKHGKNGNAAAQAGAEKRKEAKKEKEMIPWYLNPKNWLIIGVAALLVALSAAYGVQTIRLKNAELAAQKKEIVALQGQVDDYKKNIAAAKKAQAQQQQIADDTARLLAQAQKISAACALGGEDEKILSAVTYYFNSGGLRQADGDSAAGGKVLPETGAAHAAGSGWTLKNLAENYLLVIDYVLKLERTVECYETNTP